MRVLNKYNATDNTGMYIGRGSPWGNPYIIGLDGTRAEVIAKFRKYAVMMLSENPHWLSRLRGKDLVCFCAPKACHGDVLIQMIGE